MFLLGERANTSCNTISDSAINYHVAESCRVRKNRMCFPRACLHMYAVCLDTALGETEKGRYLMFRVYAIIVHIIYQTGTVFYIFVLSDLDPLLNITSKSIMVAAPSSSPVVRLHCCVFILVYIGVTCVLHK